MNNIQLERRLRRLEEKVGVKSNLHEAVKSIKFSGWTLSPLFGSNAGANPNVTDDREDFDNGVSAYVGYVDLSERSIQRLENKFSGVDLQETAIVVIYQPTNQPDEPYQLEIVTHAFHRKKEIGLSHTFELFETFDDLISYLKSKVKNPLNVSGNAEVQF